MRAGIPIADLSAGLFAAIGVLIALLEREETGMGRWVQTSLLQAQVWMMMGFPGDALAGSTVKCPPSRATTTPPARRPVCIPRRTAMGFNIAGHGLRHVHAPVREVLALPAELVQRPALCRGRLPRGK